MPSNVLPLHLKQTLPPIILKFHWRWRWWDMQTIIQKISTFRSRDKPDALKGSRLLDCFLSSFRDHWIITSSKKWVGGVRKWLFLMIYIDCCSKFATGLKCSNRHRSKSIWVTSLLFCQNDALMGESFWQKNRLVTHILFDLCLFEHFRPVANFEQQSIVL